MKYYRFIGLMSAFGLGLALLAGCGSSAPASSDTVKEAQTDSSDPAKSDSEAADQVLDMSSVSEDMQGFADKYTGISEKLSNCISSDGSDMMDHLTELNSIGQSIQKGALSDSEKTALDNLNAEVDNLLAQSKNVCDTKLNDIIALSQTGGYTGEFEQHMNEERSKYDQLIAEGKYKMAYDQLLSMEQEYNDNQ